MSSIMQLEDLVILLPCYSLEDLPLDWAADDAQSLLSAWSALYHPAILAAAGRTPRWFRADDPPPDPTGRMIAIPHCCQSRVPAEWLERANGAGACVLQNAPDRTELVCQALSYLDPDISRLDPLLADDFLALGFCHLQVELLTRQLRYMSNLDTDRFQRESVAAAKKAMEGDSQAAQDGLRSAFELLTDAREYYYPVEAHLLDLTLVVPSTAGAALREELAGDTPVNLLLTGETLDAIAQKERATLEAIRVGLEKGQVSVVGGEYQELELPLLPVEHIRRQLVRGFAAYQQHLGRRPTIFGRRRFGLTPALPGLLRGLGFSGALHFTLDDGRFPSGNQSKIRWEGCDGSTIEALARLPIDAARHEQFTKLAEKLGNTMDQDHAATVVFAHWPGHASPWYRDLKRMAEYSPVLGRFVSMDQYFEKTQMVGSLKRHAADDYRSPYLRQAVAAGQIDPISRWVRYYGLHTTAEDLRSLETLATLLTGPSADGEAERLLDEAERTAAEGNAFRADLPKCLGPHLESTAGRIADGLGGAQREASAEHGYLLLNPRSFSRRLYVQVPALSRPASAEGAVWRCVESGRGNEAVVDVPAMGFAWVGPGSDSVPAPKPSFWKRKPPKPEPPLAEPYVLRNEYFEATIDPTTGSIRSVFVHNTRGNRLAQQLALRIPAPRGNDFRSEEDNEQDYSVMAADKIDVRADALVGQIESRGRLLDRSGQLVARFIQTMVVRRGSRILELDVELDLERQPEPDPWNSYYAVRFAWSHTADQLRRGIHGMSIASEAVLMEAPQFIDLRSAKGSTTILTGGLPYHRRFGDRKLDTLLVVRGETARRFRLGIGVDLPYPVPAAVDLWAAKATLSTPRPPLAPSGWLFHVEAKNVVATDWQPWMVDGAVVGYRVRLLETEGRPAKFGIRSFRRVAAANRLDLNGEKPTVLPVEDDRVTIDIKAHQWIWVEARFQS
jgi:alpha-mannosidase